MQLMGHGGLGYRTLQLKKSPKKSQHNVNNNESSHPFFLYAPGLTLPSPMTTPAHVQDSSSFQSPNAMSPPVPKNMCGEKEESAL